MTQFVLLSLDWCESSWRLRNEVEKIRSVKKEERIERKTYKECGLKQWRKAVAISKDGKTAQPPDPKGRLVCAVSKLLHP